jgi:hypothetical protein
MQNSIVQDFRVLVSEWSFSFSMLNLTGLTKNYDHNPVALVLTLQF